MNNSDTMKTQAGDWYASSYRKLFFDFHSHSSAVGLASAFDALRHEVTSC